MTSYTVRPGDTMWSVAVKHGISLNDLITANPQIKNPSLIVTGQIINIPSTSTSTYIVKPGDTMWGIAIKNGVSLNDLITSNPQIKNPSFITPGQLINLPGSTNVPIVPDNVRDLETEVIRLVNIARLDNGLNALFEDINLSNVARVKSKDFVTNNYFSHNSPTYGSPFDMLKAFGIKFSAAAENIANGQKTANEVMNSWMSSSGHRANILNANYNKIGVGVARDNNGNLYWTQMFIKD